MEAKKLFVFLTLVLSVVGCSQASVQTAASNNPNDIVIHASYKKGFKDIKTMRQDSDLVIRGIVVDAAPARIVLDGNLSEKEVQDIKASGRIPGVVFTDYRIRINKVIKGKLKVGDEIVVVQTGGIYEGRKIYIDDDPLFESGEDVLLFLQDISGDEIHSPDSTKFILNGTAQARFKVENNRIRPVMKGNPLQDKFANEDVDKFVKEAQSDSATDGTQ